MTSKTDYKKAQNYSKYMKAGKKAGNLEKAKEYADLSNANLNGANLRNANLNGASIVVGNVYKIIR